MSEFDAGKEFGDGIKKIMLAGIGAVAITAEKSKDLIEQLVRQGEITVDQGKVLNSELKHTIENHVAPGPQSVADKLETMGDDELVAIRAKLAQIDARKVADAASAPNASDEAAD
jgi:polyhydroxyalkanoate synthesis regulator phasin